MQAEIPGGGDFADALDFKAWHQEHGAALEARLDSCMRASIAGRDQRHHIVAGPHLLRHDADDDPTKVLREADP